MITDILKTCSRCKQEKSTKKFNSHRKTKDNLSPSCKDCHNLLTRSWYKRNKEKKLKSNKKWRQENREHWNKIRYNTYWADPDKYRKLSLEQHSYKNRIYKSRISYLFKKDLIEFYRNRPVGFHVDHIVPLKGKDFCGLHVPWNLQYLPARENLSKGNRIRES